MAKKEKRYNEDGSITETINYMPNEDYKGYTQEQREIMKNTSIKKMEQSEEFKETGGFVFVLFEQGIKLNIEHPELTDSDIGKLFFIATYIHYDGLLINYNRYISKNKLQELLKLSRNHFNTFYNKMKNLNIFSEEDNKIRFNTEYFIKGKIAKKIKSENNYGKLYVNTVRFLYNNTNYKQHNILGLYFKLIPFVHRKENLICYNPDGEGLDIIPITISEFAKLINYQGEHYGRLIKNLLSLKLNDGTPIIAIIMFNYLGGDSIIRFNKYVFKTNEYNELNHDNSDAVNYYMKYFLE